MSVESITLHSSAPVTPRESLSKRMTLKFLHIIFYCLDFSIYFVPTYLIFIDQDEIRLFFEYLIMS